MTQVTRLLHQDFTVECATMTDYERVKELLYETARWLKGKGLTQWQDMTTGVRDYKIKATIEAGETFLFLKDGKVAGTLTLQRTPGEWDCDLWEARHVDYTQTLFVHRLASARAFSGQQTGAKMLEWAEAFARSEKRTWLRLDCVGDNETLNAFYKRCGFTYLGQADNGFSLYEKPVL